MVRNWSELIFWKLNYSRVTTAPIEIPLKDARHLRDVYCCPLKAHFIRYTHQSVLRIRKAKATGRRIITRVTRPLDDMTDSSISVLCSRPQWQLRMMGGGVRQKGEGGKGSGMGRGEWQWRVVGGCSPCSSISLHWRLASPKASKHSRPTRCGRHFSRCCLIMLGSSSIHAHSFNNAVCRSTVPSFAVVRFIFFFGQHFTSRVQQQQP